MIPSEVYALGASGNPIREIADYAMRRAEEVGAENDYDFSIGSPSIAPPAAAQELPLALGAACRDRRCRRGGCGVRQRHGGQRPRTPGAGNPDTRSDAGSDPDAYRHAVTDAVAHTEGAALCRLCRKRKLDAGAAALRGAWRHAGGAHDGGRV